MNNDLRTISILFGQITSSIIAILFIWIWGDTEAGVKIFSYLWFQPLIIKISLSLIIFIGSIISLYKILKMLPKDSKNDGEGRDGN